MVAGFTRPKVNFMNRAGEVGVYMWFSGWEKMVGSGESDACRERLEL